MKGPRVSILTAALVCILQIVIAASAAEIRNLTSPDGRIKVQIEMPKPGSPEKPRWSASFRDKPILSDCGLGIALVKGGELMAGARVLAEMKRVVDERVRVPFGKSEWARDRFNELHFVLENFTLEAPTGQRTDVIFRCYDDAIAVRYEIAADGRGAPNTISDETTSFQLMGFAAPRKIGQVPESLAIAVPEPRAFVQYLENYKTSHEHVVVPTASSDIRTGALLDLPLTFSWADGTYLAITEAALRNYAGMALMRAENSDDLVCKLTPRADGTKVVRSLMKTPWRVVLIGDRPGALLESETIYCLNEPNSIGDTSWIKPGKLTFHWWNGDVYDGKPGAPMLSFEMSKKYIDFCASNGIEFHGISSTEGTTDPWYYQTKRGTEPGPDTDVTRPREGFELERIRKYADSKGVRLWTWVHQAALRGKLEEAFAAFEKMGWAGMMVDFFDHDDQDHVKFVEKILEAAARHHILIHLHGIWKPTGLERTYPNLMNHEGALNLEYLKWTNLCTPEHTLMMAFTRQIAGPTDYHLGGFRAVSRSEFKPHKVAPNVLGTRCHQLALYVCFDNPTPMVADYPTAYIDQPGFDFLRTVPTYWDETKVLQGEIGEVLVTARRKGNTWYVGGLSAKGPRELTVSLKFLGSGEYEATVWRDTTGADPNQLEKEASKVSASGELKVRVAVDGGFVARFAK